MTKQDFTEIYNWYIAKSVPRKTHSRKVTKCPLASYTVYVARWLGQISTVGNAKGWLHANFEPDLAQTGRDFYKKNVVFLFFGGIRIRLKICMESSFGIPHS